MKDKSGKIISIFCLAAATASFFLFDLQQYFSLAYVQSQEAALKHFCANNIVLSFVLFVFSYAFLTMFPLPIAMLIGLVGGAAFGFPQGAIFNIFSSTIGASIAFIVSRRFFLGYVQKKHRDKLKVINDGIKKDGAYYLFALRLTPVFPYFLINILMGLTQMRLSTFYLVSKIAMFPEVLILAYLGQQLAQVESLSDVISPSIIISLTILGLIPLLVKLIKNRKKQM